MIQAQPLHELCRQGIQDRVFPAASFAVGTADEVAIGCVGKFTYEPKAPNVQPDSLFDLASLTKVVGTTSAAMMALDDGLIDLEQPVAKYLPEFVRGGESKSAAKVKDLLLHCSGLPAYSTFHRKTKTPDEAREAVLGLPFEYATEAKTVYSCMGFISLMMVLEHVTGKPLDRFLAERLFEPLGMARTLYNPSEYLKSSCVPTEDDKEVRKKLIQGEVHDPAAFAMGGVSGNAGLFSTATDLAKFCQMMLRRGDAGCRQIICSETIERWTTKQGANGSTRGFGWDTKSEIGSSAGSKFSMKSYGHTGFTGTTIWIDPERAIFAVLLTNRVHPTSENQKLTPFRPKFHDLVVDVLAGA